MSTNLSNLLFKKSIKNLIAVAVTLLPLSGCVWLDRTGIDIKISSVPNGIDHLKSGELITLAGSRKINSEFQKINFIHNFVNENTTGEPEIVVALFGGQIKLIDFFIPEINEKPDLSFYSTARSLVFIHPLFLGLPKQQRISVFQEIPNDKKFNQLAELIAKTGTIVEEKIADLSTEIAVRVAEKHGLITSEKQANTKIKTFPFQQILNTSNFANKDKVANLGNLRTPKNIPTSFNFNLSPINILSIKELINPTLNTLIPAANAQNLQAEPSWLEYSLVSQFNNDGLFPGTQWPLWHGLELKVESSGIKIVGTSPIAQQVLVYPSDKDWRKDGAVVIDKIIYPANLGTWDGNTIKTLSGQNQVEMTLTPKSGSTWDEGTYTVLISGGYSLRSRTGFDAQNLEAFDINILLLITDSLVMFSGLERDELFKEIVENTKNITQLGGNCRIALESKENKSSLSSIYNALAECLTGGENLKILATLAIKAFPDSTEDDIKKLKKGNLSFDEKIIIKLLAPLFQFQALSLEKLEGTGKKAAKAIDVLDRAVSLNRALVLGLYLQHENEKGLYYSGGFSVSQPTQAYPSKTKTLPSASRELELDCSPDNPGGRQYQELDVIIKVSCRSSSQGGISLIEVTNYSTNAVEVNLQIPGVLPDLLLPNKSNKYTAAIPWDLRDRWKNRPEGIKTSALDSFDFIERFLPYKLPLSLTSYSSRQLVKEVRVKCSDSPTTLWGVKIEPQCVPPGLRAKYKNMTHESIGVGIVGLNKPPIYLEPRESWDTQGFGGGTGGSGNVQSSRDNVTMSIVINY